MPAGVHSSFTSLSALSWTACEKPAAQAAYAGAPDWEC